MSTSTDPEKVVDDGRFIIFDSFGDEVEQTNDYEYAMARADANDGWVDERKADGSRTIYDSEDE